MFRRSLITLPFILSFAFGGALTGTVKNNANGKSIPNANIYIVEIRKINSQRQYLYCGNKTGDSH